MTFPLIFDDAAIYPPGNLPLTDAIVAHRGHLAAAYSRLVGPLVVGLADLPALAGEGPLQIAVVVPDASGAAEAIARVRDLDGICLVALEVRDAGIEELAEAIGEPDGVAVYIEVPRDARSAGLISELASTAYRAKLRTGGLEQAMYPDEAELASALVALTAAKVPFKATAGLHHALRNTDPETGLEQHGFVNILAATERARLGADVDEVAAVLAIRDASQLPPLPESSPLLSIGTCVIAEPVEEIAALGLVTL
ncbi:hypothetical protein Back2_28480 [Nocardioides baekrokdamisoli]|uniref:Uncharacterized protein n=1 Tax=Nocardioides baekrokdamisoli TaxID=1804624 RepID=A0A3G9IY01_9ACTN|nr:hypothetical protein [Nocardioides baekrokdamisoli]BBH18561.1 hypothetical protein Back2_28480 [Nocardioides baekrokdamisoli]